MEKDRIYAVVLFLPRKETENLVDLILSNWICTTKRGTLQCKYPHPEEYTKLPEWIASLEPPNKDWQNFEIEVVSYARK